MPDTWSPLTLACDQMAKMGKSMTSPPCSITDGYLWPNWGKYWLAVLRWIYMKHSQTVKWRRHVGQRDVCACGDSIPLWAQHPHNHIHHLENSLNPNIYALLRFQETDLLIEALVFGHWSESQCLSLFPEGRNYKPLFSSLSVEYSILSVWYSSSVWLSNCIPEIITWPMKESKFQEFQEACFNETGKGSNMEKIITVKRQQGKGPGDFCNIVSAMIPHPTAQGLCFLFHCICPPLWFKVFWLLLIIHE